ncbi:MAG: hypothetical protein ACLUD0_12540 [Eubacterium ramulus]
MDGSQAFRLERMEPLEKCTAIKLILGLTEAESGEITIFGKCVHQLSMSEKAQIGASLAESGFSSYLNITDVKKILEKMYPDFNKGYFEKKCRELNLPEKSESVNILRYESKIAGTDRTQPPC